MARILDFILHAKGNLWKVFEKGNDLSVLLLKMSFWLLQGEWEYGGDKGRIIETKYSGVLVNRNVSCWSYDRS